MWDGKSIEMCGYDNLVETLVLSLPPSFINLLLIIRRDIIMEEE
jgi:hypothetical protein